MRRLMVVSAVLLFILSAGAAQASALAAGMHSAKPPLPSALVVSSARPAASGGRVGQAAVPAAGTRPPVLSAQAAAALRAAMAKPRSSTSAPIYRPARGMLTRPVGSAVAAPGHSYWNGSRWVAPAVRTSAAPRSTPRLLVPVPPTGRAKSSASPSVFYSSTQVDSATSSCSDPRPNEPSVAQSVDNPEDVVVAAQAYVNAAGACADSQPWVFYSHDGGQHWQEQVIPGLTAGLAGGDVGVVYDAKDHVFVYSFLQFSRTTSQNSVNVASSVDGSSWFDLTTLDSAPGALDKDMITVNQDSSSPNYGRVLVSWRDESVGQDAFIDAYSDNGGGSWTSSADSINVVPDCGNGTSPAFDANGDAMVAWEDCNGGFNIEEELSTDGGANWTASSNTTISGVNALDESGCDLNAGGTVFRCNSFPSLAGDPNSADAGGTAFFVVFANEESTTSGGVTANVSQLHGLSTTDGGSSWSGGPSFSFNYMAFRDFGDKFFPWAAFAPNGRLNVGYSDREASASAGNPNGSSYNEGQTEASSLSSLRSASYIAYTADATLGNPGSLTFIGDYDGIESLDNNYDTFPVWTDVRNGTLDVRTMDLCYADCPTVLQPETPVTASHTAGSSFSDLYQFNTNPSFGGAGSDYWNAVGIREGTNGTSVDDDMGLWNSRYFTSRVALGDMSPPYNDYVLENGNVNLSQPYFVDSHSFSTSGGPYTIEWAHGHIVLGSNFADSMNSGDVVRVYDTLDSTNTTYFEGLRPNPGNTSNYRVSLHLNGNGSFQGSNNYSATSGNVTPASPAFLSVNTSGRPSGYDAVVVQNNNGGSGSYTLYRDTAAPAGTLSINAGAAFTTAAAVTLTLNATNPTAGDPVSDMRFSNDGVNFGPWQPYAAHAAYSLPPGNGAKTVYAQYRNGAGAVSATTSANITLLSFGAVSGSATDISVGANNSVWAIGTNAVSGGYGIYHRTGSSWTSVAGGAVTIADDPSGNPFVLNSAHQIFHWNGSSWVHYSGAATDIAVGANGSVWAIGTNAVSGGFGIYHWTGSSWSSVAGGAVTIAVDPSGTPWVLNSAHQIFRWNGSSWVHYSGAATDIAVGANGWVWIVGTNPVAGGYEIYNLTGGGWAAVAVGAVTISVASNGHPWIINSAHQIFSS